MPTPPRHPAATPRQPLGRRPAAGPQAGADADDWPVDRGRPLALRLLALVGALAFVMLGLSVITPLLAPPPKAPAAPGGTGASA